MLNFKEFDRMLTTISYIRECITKDTEAFNKVFEDFQGVPLGLTTVEDKLIAILEDAMGDKELISWYIFDTSMGEIPLEITIDGIGYVIDSNEMLYKILKEMDESY